MATLENLGFSYFPKHKGWQLVDKEYQIKVREEGENFLTHIAGLMDAPSWGGKPEESWYSSFGTYRLSAEQLTEAVGWCESGFADDYELSNWGDEVVAEPRVQ